MKIMNPSIYFLTFTLTIACLIVLSCNHFQPLSAEEAEHVKTALNKRSFRQFDPALDARKRKAIVLDFSDGIQLYAQYTEDKTALNEWEISAKEDHIEKAGTVYRLHCKDPRVIQILPKQPDKQIQIRNLSISIRNLFDKQTIQFKLNPGANRFPLPFPVFESWTRFREPKVFH